MEANDLTVKIKFSELLKWAHELANSEFILDEVIMELEKKGDNKLSSCAKGIKKDLTVLTMEIRNSCINLYDVIIENTEVD